MFRNGALLGRSRSSASETAERAEGRARAHMVTAADVARMAGVSTSTVSRVFSNSGYVSAQARSAVMLASDHLGYVPNATARSLKTQRSGLIAFLMPEILDPYFFTTLAHGVEEVANANGYQILLGNNDEDPQKERNYLKLMVSNSIEGIIITPTARSPRAYQILDERRIPAVFVDRVVPGLKVDTVRSDDHLGAKLLVDHLAALGHRRMALVNGSLHTSVAIDRDAGFRAAMNRAALPVDDALVTSGPWFADDAERRLDAILANRRDFTAVLAANLNMAVGALRALRKHKIRVPEDIALVSFNDLELAAEITPFLTVLSQPIYSMGRIAMGLLLERIRGQYRGEPRQVVLTPQLVVRRSCGTDDAN